MSPRATVALSALAGAVAATVVALLLWPEPQAGPARTEGRASGGGAADEMMAAMLAEMKALRRDLAALARGASGPVIQTERFTEKPEENPMAGVEELLRQILARTAANPKGGAPGVDLRDPNLLPPDTNRGALAARLANTSDEDWRKAHLFFGYADILQRYGLPDHTAFRNGGLNWYYNEPSMHFQFYDGLLTNAYK